MDSLAAVLAILAVLISVNLPKIPGGVDSFLSARITVKNVLLVILLATAWPLLFHLFGLYEARHIRRLGSEVGRLVGAHHRRIWTGTRLSPDERHRYRDVWDVPSFWLVSLALCLLVRTGRRAVDLCAVAMSADIDTWSPVLDLRILAQTIPAVLAEMVR